MSRNIIKNSHFIGYKIRQLRKSLGLTLEDLSVRCIQMNANTAPSVSYLSLIETGHRKPSENLITMLQTRPSELLNRKLSLNSLEIRILRLIVTGSWS